MPVRMKRNPIAQDCQGEWETAQWLQERVRQAEPYNTERVLPRRHSEYTRHFYQRKALRLCKNLRVNVDSSFVRNSPALGKLTYSPAGEWLDGDMSTPCNGKGAGVIHMVTWMDCMCLLRSEKSQSWNKASKTSFIWHSWYDKMREREETDWRSQGFGEGSGGREVALVMYTGVTWRTVPYSTVVVQSTCIRTELHKITCTYAQAVTRWVYVKLVKSRSVHSTNVNFPILILDSGHTRCSTGETRWGLSMTYHSSQLPMNAEWSQNEHLCKRGFVSRKLFPVLENVIMSLFSQGNLAWPGKDMYVHNLFLPD